jgi:hypothetical protein
MHVLKSVLPYILPFIAIAGFAAAVGKPEPNHTLITPGKVALEWTFHEESRVWCEFRSFNGSEWGKEGYHPSFTYIYVKDYVPTVKKIDADHYQITFHSPIATDIP